MSLNVDLNELAKLGILKTMKIGKQMWFAYDDKRDPEIQQIQRDYIRLHRGKKRNDINNWTDALFKEEYAIESRSSVCEPKQESAENLSH